MTVTKQYFGTDGIRGRTGSFPITPEFILKLGFALGRVFTNKQSGSCRVVIGKDTRISGEMFESALQAGLIAAGVNVVQLGVLPTPGVAYLTRALKADLGIVISASHNPFVDNGFKFFSSQGSKLSDEEELAIESAIDESIQCVPSKALGGVESYEDALDEYVSFCQSSVTQDLVLEGKKVVVDCAHGATYRAAPVLLEALGATVYCIASEPTGMNINDACGSTSPEALQIAVKQYQADLGIAFDGDGDRVVMIDECGELVDGDALLYIMVQDALHQHIAGSGVVGTVMSNMGLEDAVKKLGLEFRRVPVGDRYVLAELKKQGWFYGGEASGHVVCLNKTTTGDGLISALQVVEAWQRSGKTFSELAKDLVMYPQVLINIELKNRDPALLERPDVQAIIDSAEVKLNGSGRILVRLSGTEPLLRVMVEGQSEDLTQLLARNLAQALQKLCD